MLCKQTLDTITTLCRPAINVGLIPEGEFKELIKSAKLPDHEKENLEPEIKLFTKKQAAEKLQISVRQLDRFHEAGYLRYIRIGTRSLRIPADSLFSYMENGIPEAV
jgi:excisionase family DNA binding protein